MSRILFIHGGDSYARATFAAGGPGYWSRALRLVLEKHGLLGLTETETLDWDTEQYDAVLVARLADGSWSGELAERAVAGPVPTLVEGPLADPLLSALRVEDHGELPSNGSIQVRDAGLRAAASRYGIPPHGSLAFSSSSEIARPAELEWRELGVPITDEQARVWRAEDWQARRWRQSEGSGTHSLADWVSPEGERVPVIVRREHLIGCSFGLFDLLGRRHTSEPFEPGEWRTSPRVVGLEAILLGLVDEMHRDRDATRARVLPWPHPYRWVRSVRHDFDRPLSAPDTTEVLDGHRRLGSRATWYWRARHADSEALPLVAADPGHEVALHTERIWTAAGPDERRAVESASGRPVLGTAAHGGSDCFRYQGAPNVLWADEEGLAYTELPQQWHLHPHRFATLEPNGRIAFLGIVCLPHHLSFDRTTRPGDTLAADIDRALPLWMTAGGLAQIMNHPDINAEEFSAWLAKAPDEGRLDWTAAEVADWWRRTHSSDTLALQAAPDGRFEVTSQLGASGLAVELLDPDGTSTKHIVELEPGDTALVGPAERRPSWRDVSDAFADSVRAYHVGRGEDPVSASVRTTIRTNGELVPQRGDLLIRLLDELAGVTMQGRRVLDLGCGFGALATYLAWKGDPQELVAIDTRADYVGVARQSADAIGLSEVLGFEIGDMRALDGLGAGRFDVVIANNSFIYLPTPRDVRQALREIHDVLRPGGHVLFYQANKWRWDEPFTKDPVVHLLPPWLGRAVSKVTGWRHNHGRVRLLSPMELRWRLRRANFADFRVRTFGKYSDARAPLRYIGGFYAAAARKRGDRN